MAETILVVDIGSTKVAAVIAEKGDDGTLMITGHGVARSLGVKKGVITNIELASKSIKKAVGDARRIAGKNISEATISISNAYAKNLNSAGIVNIPNQDITIKEIRRVMDTALYNANIPNEFEVLHVLPYNFKVDEQDFIEDPYGMNASRMEVEVSIIVTQKSVLSNLTKAVRSAGLEINGIVLNSYASALAVMGEDERELGVCVIDIGGHTSNMVIHIGNSIRYNNFLAVGSNHITNDLSMALHTPLETAERVKICHGNLLETSNESIELPLIGDAENRNNISLEIIHNVILARVEEALLILAQTLDKSRLEEQIGSGIVITGGMTKLKGIRELAQAIFHGIPVRIGLPRQLGGMYDELKDPVYATVIGLLLYRVGEYTQYEIDHSKTLLHRKNEQGINVTDIADIGRLQSNDIDIKSKDKEENIDIGIEIEHLKKVGDRKEEDLFSSFSQKREGNSLSRFVNWAKQLF